MNEFIEQFLLESRELVEAATRDLLWLERNPEDGRTLDGAFRAFHTLKGGAGIVDFAAMARAVHAAEDILSSARTGARRLTPSLVGDCLECLDQVTRWLERIEVEQAFPSDAEASAETLIARFSQRTADVPPDGAAGGVLTKSARAVLEAQVRLLAETEAEGQRGRTASAARTAANVLRRLSMLDRAEAIGVATDPASLAAAVESILAGPESAQPAESEIFVASASAEAAPRTLRVNAERIDRLVDLTGELIIAKNAIGHLAKVARDRDGAVAAGLGEQHAELDRLLGELQKSVLALRVLPVRQVFRRFPRLVREISAKSGRPVRLVTEGEDTEADKTVVEALYEPLLHAVRNAMDHGVEPLERRKTLGKPPVATIWLRAGRRGEHVVVEVEDDGGGVDIAKVRQVAIQRGIVTADEIASRDEAELLELVFSPGFSTKSAVTDLSGRGVGMDAARTAVEALGGRISIESRTDRGSLVRFSLPFSAMMTRVMTVAVGDQTFGLPLESVVETVRVERATISPIGLSRALVWRDRTVPLIDLAETLDYRETRRSSPLAVLVILSIEGQLGALEVDRLGERMDVMLKPMNGVFGGTAGVLGATLMGDGKILLVLDVQELLS